MRLIRFIKIVIFITILSLGYIHLQMRIFDMAYLGKEKERKIKQLTDENGNLTYAILTIKSSANLGFKMLSENSSLKFMDPNNIVEIVATQDLPVEPAQDFQAARSKMANSLLSLLSIN